ncbi:MAG: MvaI/BcnI restriction endonuclease family protein [Lentisphaeraceae bacterium]|nr:MvaI/BcnI restriction endonuclease family protein [Lentisphaeraceae bacterium]
MKRKVFSEKNALNISLDQVKDIFHDQGVEHVYYKLLAPNDNSKNQVYIASHLDELKFLPQGELKSQNSSSQKKSKDSVRFLYSFKMKWLTADGISIDAPNSKMIYYPQYPEVRFSGFLQGAYLDSDGWFDRYKKGTAENRILLIGCSNDTLYGWLATPESNLSKEIQGSDHPIYTNILKRIDTKFNNTKKDSKQCLIKELRRIHETGWISSKKLNNTGIEIPYKAPNGGGYTLEAELGVSANGYASPDFMDWEVKQYSVSKLSKPGSKALTLMTPEPNGGIYCEPGFITFMKLFGYPDRIREDRINFNGTHRYGKYHDKTHLKFTIEGYNKVLNKIDNSDGYIGLVSKDNKIAASWSFSKMLNHWRTKHAKAAYIPSICDKSHDIPKYKYGHLVQLYEGTNFLKLLTAITADAVYYDPGCKIENVNTKPVTKRRNQFRVNSKKLEALYFCSESVDLLSI